MRWAHHGAAAAVAAYDPQPWRRPPHTAASRCQRCCPTSLLLTNGEVAHFYVFLPRSVPNITAYHGAFQTQNEICIVMEYCPRGDLLEQLLSEGRVFSEPRVAEVASALLVTLQVRKLHRK